MTVTRFSLLGYAHLYRSLLRFLEIDTMQAKYLVYILNISNLDSYSSQNPNLHISEISKSSFYQYLDKEVRPYYTEVQLYKSLYALWHNIDSNCLIAEQREAILQLNCIMENLSYHFYESYGVEIDSIQTVYKDCCYGLVPRSNEPMTCLT